MGREIHYYVRSDRAYTAAELLAANDVVLAFNDIFKDGGRWAYGLFNFGEIEGAEGGERFFGYHKESFGSTKPYGEAPALFLLAGLAALSKVLPGATITVDDEGEDETYFAVRNGSADLRNGKWVEVMDGVVIAESPAHTAADAGQWISELNACRAKGMRPFRRKSVRGGLLASQLPALFADVERAITARIAAGNLPSEAHVPACGALA